MKKILITGFEPFGGRSINPSGMLARDVAAPRGAELVRLTLPVEYKRAGALLEDAVYGARPDIILSLGQAGNQPFIAVERAALNLDCSLSGDGVSLFADEGGDAPVDRPIQEDGPAALFSTLPVWDMVKSVNDRGVACRASYSAGTFVCNHVMYTGCSIAARTPGLRSGFVHVPFLPEQQSGRGFSMEYADMLTGITAIVQLLADKET